MGELIMGIADPRIVNYCPRCGGKEINSSGDGSVTCGNCALHFYAIEGEESEELENESS